MGRNSLEATKAWWILAVRAARTAWPARVFRLFGLALAPFEPLTIFLLCCEELTEAAGFAGTSPVVSAASGVTASSVASTVANPRAGHPYSPLALGVEFWE